MSILSKPSGYSTVSPYLVVAGAQRVIDFAKAVFEAKELRRYNMPDGSIMHAEVRIGDTVVMLGDAGTDWPPVGAWMHVYVDDADATFQRAIEAGATVILEPTEREGDPDRRGGFRDPAGNVWWIATPVA